MSIASVGGTFGYVDPSTVAGPGRATQVQADSADTTTDDHPSPPPPSPSNTPPPPALTSGQPTFAPATAATLFKVQETAFASTT